MEFILNRYRNLTVLLVVIAVQLVLIAYQVRTAKDVPLLRVWAVTAVTPIERGLELVRRNTWGFVEDYFVLLHTRQQNEVLQKEVGRLKLENQYLQTQLSTAERAKELSQFEAETPSRMIAARIIGNATGANSKAVFVDRGSGNGVESGMAVLTPDGIVGKVIAAYPTASLVLLITDANFAAGVISQKNRVHGTLKGQGHDGAVLVDYVQPEEKVDPGEWFFTSGDDRIFPKGFPVGKVSTARNERNRKQIYLSPSGFQNGLEEVLIVLEGVHQPIPDNEPVNARVNLIPAPDADGADRGGAAVAGVNTDADRLKEQYREAGDAQHHTFGEGTPGSIPPDFTKLPGLRENAAGAAAAKSAPAAGGILPTTPPSATGTQAAAGTLSAAKPNPAAPGQSSTVPPTSREPGTGAAGSAATLANTAVKPKPKAPILVTDPTDADPDEPLIVTPPKKKTVVGDTEILPPAPAPKPKSNGH